MTWPIVKVYMIEIKPKDFISLQNTLKSSVEDSQNLIVDVEELKTTFSKMKENNKIQDLLREIIETIPNGVNYVWFYL